MTKPILVIKCPSQERISDVNKVLEDHSIHSDYHVFLTQGAFRFVEFECLNSDNIDNATIEELKEKLRSDIDKD